MIFPSARSTGGAPASASLAAPSLPVALALAIATATPAGAGERTPLTYRTPPAPGDPVVAQRDLLVCDAPAPARATARTGFVARGCRRLGAETGWRVVELAHEEIEDGGLWLVRVARREPEHDGAPDGVRETGWIPLPWHDWA